MQKSPHFFTQYLRAFSRSLPAKACLVWSGVVPLFLATPSLAQSNEIELPQFFDVSNHWAEACIEGVGKDKLMSGYLDRSFRPDGTMTRAEFAAAIVKAFPNAPMVREAPDFSDVAQNFWGRNAIQTAYERGFLAGYPGNLFKPNQAISRVQAMVIIANTQAHLGIEVSADSDEAVLNRFFEDAIAIPNYARKAIARATRDSLVVSYPNAKQLRPNDSITRGEATALLCRVNENGSDARHYVAADYVAAFGYQFDPAGLPVSARPQPVPLTSFDSALDNLLLWNGVEVGEQLFFIDTQPDAATLWKTDGTAAGTQLVQSLGTGLEGRAISMNAASFFGVGDKRLWMQTQQEHGAGKRAGVWSSDGAAEGTQEAANFSPELADAIAQSDYIQTGWYPTTALNERVPLVINSKTDSQLWITDGQSQAGTEKLAAFTSTAVNESGVPNQYFTATDDYLFFMATASEKDSYGAAQANLWRTDGTSGGTLSLQKIGKFDPTEPLFPWQNRVYFVADTPEAGEELWTSDGTAAGTLLLKDIYPGERKSSVNILGRTKTAIFMLANSPEGMGLWKTEGTPESTRLVKRLGPENLSPDAVWTEIDEGRFFFELSTGLTPAAGMASHEIWVSDGTSVGTQLVDELPGAVSAGAIAFKGNLFFSNRGLDGEELWISDGTAQGTRQLVDLTPGKDLVVASCPQPPAGIDYYCPPPTYVPKNTRPRGFVVQGNFLYFIATGNRLFRTDGTVQGMELVSLLDGDNGLSSNMTGLGNKLLFIDGRDRPQLWAITADEMPVRTDFLQHVSPNAIR